MKIAQAATGRFALICYMLFLAVAALAGGGGHYYGANQPVIRLAAILLIGALVLGSTDRISDHKRRSYRPAFWFVGAIAFLILLQLVPLPPSLWGALPGHARYLAAATAAGEAQPWRPINLTPDLGWNALFALLPPIAVFFAASRLPTRQQMAVLRFLLLIVMADAVLGLAQVSAGEEALLRFYSDAPADTAVGVFANRNNQALLIDCGLPMLAVWANRARTDRAKARLHGALALVSAAFLVLMIPAAASRSGLALAGLALPCAIWFAWPLMKSEMERLSPRRRQIAMLCGVVALAVLITAALTFSRAVAVSRLLSTDVGEEMRVQILPTLWAMIRDFFPVGSGFGSFDLLYRGFEPFRLLNFGAMNEAHDDYLQVVLEAGLPGLLLLIAFIGWWGRTTFRLWRRPDSERTALGRLGSVLILLMMLASITEFPVRKPLIMVLFAQSAAWMLLPRRRQDDPADA